MAIPDRSRRRVSPGRAKQAGTARENFRLWNIALADDGLELAMQEHANALYRIAPEMRAMEIGPLSSFTLPSARNSRPIVTSA